ncbi:hypothetical protein BZG36_03082 [Bifiguratus adelaidae]|uniref:Protein BIG1 n=1 Tax=Bifiguratus adelaidae TaxID=1938954 RepID=A0A261XZD8_9FUNG|nr:hypothetical protein BZG36_03082 [Bifiguratus adelaidae]
MRPILPLLALSLSFNLSYAFTNTSPFLICSPNSISSDVVANVDKSAVFQNHRSLDNLLVTLEPEFCKASAVVIADRPNLHASELRASDFSTVLKSECEESNAWVKVPYVKGGVDSVRLVDTIAARCKSQVHDELDNLQGGKMVLRLASPSEESLKAALAKIKTVAGNNYVLIFTSSRAETESAHHPSLVHQLAKRAPGNSTVPDPNSGLFHRYQFFTPGVWMCTIVGLIFLGVLAFGLSWLTNLQTPVRFEGNPKQKKNQ